MDRNEVQIIRDTGFGQVKRSILRDNSISIEAKAIYSYFCGFAGSESKAYPLRETIIKELGISIKRYYKYLKELQEKNIIKIQQVKISNGLSRNIYYINDCPTKSCSQNDHIVCSQNDHIEYNNRIITYNNNPPISPQGEKGEVESQIKNIDVDIKDTEKTQSSKSEKEVQEDTPEEKANKAINSISTDKGIKKVIKDFAGDDIDLIDALKEFYRARSKLKKPLTARALKLNINSLKNLSMDRDEQIEIINQSIEKGWQSFYELPKDHPYQREKSIKENSKYGYVF
ncbi:helix-turn-helix domain-containing protein [Peptoniphilus sp. AGMB00490]|uniref:Helix-turn-helix domain-containing protein n=1 Tax=Peptoniphilus faecalis TaxID=2731255 RepID=A0A848R4S6_9FIRM|nr:helix-turn-helix domain-containing protein [Peptoniphilus faecalis]NMW84247.1 helix-turn-helix domain-containing protein [Peptoniphilus faecalis]